MKAVIITPTLSPGRSIKVTACKAVKPNWHKWRHLQKLLCQYSYISSQNKKSICWYDMIRRISARVKTDQSISWTGAIVQESITDIPLPSEHLSPDMRNSHNLLHAIYIWHQSLLNQCMNSFANTVNLNHGDPQIQLQLKHISTWLGMKTTSSGEKKKSRNNLKTWSYWKRS